MQISFARAGMAPTWDILAKTLLLCNIVDIEHAAALNYFLNNHFLGSLINNNFNCSGMLSGNNNTNNNNADTSASSQAVLLLAANNNNGSTNKIGGGGVSTNNNNKNVSTQQQLAFCSAMIATFISHIGAHRHTQDEYTAVFATLLSNEGCHVAAHHIIRSLKVRNDANERVRQGAAFMLRSSQKPSLTDMVARHQETLLLGTVLVDSAAAAAAVASVAAKRFHRGSFPEFCSAARMQSNASARIRRACYYIMSLPPHNHCGKTLVICGSRLLLNDDNDGNTEACSSSSNKEKAKSWPRKGEEVVEEEEENNNNKKEKEEEAEAEGGGNYSAAITHADALRCLIGDDSVVLSALGPIAAITTPDMAVLRLFIEEVQHTGRPLRCLRSFRDAMIPNPGPTNTMMHWSAVLRLYLAAYSRCHLELWTHAVSMMMAVPAAAGGTMQQLLNPETDKIIRNYVTQHPIALLELIPGLAGEHEEDSDGPEARL
jgi:hypothetical protein